MQLFNMSKSSPESLVTQIQALSGKRDLDQLHAVLRGSEVLNRANYATLVSILDQINPSDHSLGYLYTLDACLSKKLTNELFVLISKFIESCDASQIQLATDKFIGLGKRIKEHAAKDPIRGVGPLVAAVKKLQSFSPEKLTPLHPDALLLCVLAKCYKAGFSILEHDVVEVEKPKDFYLYCYYGGMVCIGQKKFGKAAELLQKVVTAPMRDLSAIAVEAYKKYVLVSLIQTGQFSTSLPKYASQIAQKNIKNLSQLYVSFAEKYAAGNSSQLESFVRENRGRFEGDNNLGLAKQAVNSMYKRSIQRLTKTYLTLSLQDIADRVRLKSAKEAEMQVLQMIQDGEIYAWINQKDGMVRFLEDPEEYKTARMVNHMDSSIQRIMALSKKMTEMDEQMACDPMYLGKFGKERHDHGFDYDQFDPDVRDMARRRGGRHGGGYGYDGPYRHMMM